MAILDIMRRSLNGILMSKRGVLLLGNYLSRTRGTRGFAEDLSDRLAQHGWNVFRASTIPNRFGRMFDILRTIWFYRHEYVIVEIDLYSGLAFWWAYTAAHILRMLGKPFVLNLQGGNLPTFARRYHGRVESLFNMAAAIVSPSNYLKAAFSDIRTDIYLFRNAIDLHPYGFVHRAEPKAKLTWLRAFHAIYNPSLGAETLAILRDEFPDVQLTMYGPDKADGSLEKLWQVAEHLGIAELLTTPGSVPKHKVPEHIVEHDIFLNTTNVDNSPTSVIEAMACGLCVVSTDVGGLPFLLTHDHDALLVPPDDPQAMADAVRRILTEPGLAERLSRNARTTAEQFDWSVVLPQWETLLLDVIERHKHG